MRRGKAKRKTEVMTLRVSPLVKAAAQRVAAHDQRSVTNMVEVLILDRCRALNIPIDTFTSKEPSK